MKISRYVSKNAFQTNGYIVEAENKNAVLIDAPLVDAKTLEMLDSEGVTVTKILLTHGHCDHIDSLALFAEKFGAQVYIHESDEKKLHDDYLNLSEYFSDCYREKIPHFSGAMTVKDGDVITEGELSFRVLHTPGHTSGSVCYIAENVIFSGDTLFRNSVGRTDMPDGDPDVLAKSLEKLAAVKGDYSVLSGHGLPTELALEITTNPYLRGDAYEGMF